MESRSQVSKDLQQDCHVDDRGKLIDLFRRWNVSGDGLISEEELRDALVEIGISKASVPMMFAFADLDKDGRLSFDEFEVWIHGPAAPAQARWEVKGKADQSLEMTLQRLYQQWPQWLVDP